MNTNINNVGVLSEVLTAQLVFAKKALRLPIPEARAEIRRAMYRDLYCRHIISQHTFDEKIAELDSLALDEKTMSNFKLAVAQID